MAAIAAKSNAFCPTALFRCGMVAKMKRSGKVSIFIIETVGEGEEEEEGEEEGEEEEEGGRSGFLRKTSEKCYLLLNLVIHNTTLRT